MHVGIRIGLGVRAFRAVALGIGHGDADGEVGGADVLVISPGPGEVLGAVLGVDRGGALQDAGHGVAGQVTLGAAGVAADQAHGLELLQQLVAAMRHMQHAVVILAAVARGHAHQHGGVLAQGEVVTQADGIDAGQQRRLVGHAVHRAAIDIDLRLQAAQGFAVVGGSHQHGFLLGTGSRY